LSERSENFSFKEAEREAAVIETAIQQNFPGDKVAKSESYALSEADAVGLRQKDNSSDNGLKDVFNSKTEPPDTTARDSGTRNQSLPPHFSHAISKSLSNSKTTHADIPRSGVGSAPTTPTRKLASEKKRLQSHRHRIKKTAGAVDSEVAKVGSSDQGNFNGQDSKSIQKLASEDQEMLSLILDPTPKAEESASKYTPVFGERGLSDAQTKNAVVSTDRENLVQNDSELSRMSDADSAFAGLLSTASSLSASSLAGRAGKVLQKRRRKGNIAQHNVAGIKDTSSAQRVVNEQMDQGSPLLKQAASSQAEHPDVKDEQCFDQTDDDEIFVGDERPRLSTKYNTSSRFVEDNKSGGAKRQFLKLTISRSTDSGESSHYSSVDAATTDSESRYALEKSSSDASRGIANRRTRRLHPIEKAPDRRLKDDKSVNIESSQSGCESVVSVKDVASDWVPASFDINKLASAVDEKMTALRDYVGGTKKAKPSLKIPDRGNTNSLDVEDVAIEVEYVEEDDDEDDDSSDDSPQDVSAEFPSAEKKTEHDFGADFSDMEVPPAGQSSFEEADFQGYGGRHSGYV
jgi:hypothetical protein